MNQAQMSSYKKILWHVHLHWSTKMWCENPPHSKDMTQRTGRKWYWCGTTKKLFPADFHALHIHHFLKNFNFSVIVSQITKQEATTEIVFFFNPVMLTHWRWVVHIYASARFVIIVSAIIWTNAGYFSNWTPRNKFQWHSNKKYDNFHSEKINLKMFGFQTMISSNATYIWLTSCQ